MKFKNFKIVKICLMIKIKLFSEKNFVLKFYIVTIISVRSHFYEKREGPDSYL
jgi:hypothetical protein